MSKKEKRANLEEKRREKKVMFGLKIRAVENRFFSVEKKIDSKIEKQNARNIGRKKSQNSKKRKGKKSKESIGISRKNSGKK